MTNASGGLLGYADIGGGQVEVRFTIAGDANLDGTVDTVDFNLLASNFSQSGKDWMDGDFNYDGTIDTVDFNLLASKFSQTLAGPAAPGTVVPEPAAALSILALGAFGILSRRRHCNFGRNPA